MALTFFFTFLKLLAFLLACYLPGRVLLNATTLSGNRQPHFRNFLALLFGVLLAAGATAAFATGFKTVLLLFFGILGAIFYTFRKPELNRKDLFRDILNRQLLWPAAGTMVLFAAGASSMSGNSVAGFVFPWRDNIFYALLSNHIFNTGVESFYLASTLTDPANAKPVPYHYFEMWLNAAFSETFSGLYFLNFMLVTAVALRVLIFAGLLALWEHFFGKLNAVGALLCLLLLFLKGIVLPGYAEKYPHILVIDQLSVNPESIKFLTGYVFFVAFANAFLRRQWLLGTHLILAFPVAHVLAIPGLLAGFGGLFLVYLICSRWEKLPRPILFRVVFSVVTVLFFFGLFYFLFGAQSGTRSQNVLLILKTFKPDEAKLIYRHFKESLLKAWLVAWPFLLFGLAGGLVTYRKHRTFSNFFPTVFLLAFALSALIGGALVTGLLFRSIEGHQPLQILAPFLNISFWLIILAVLKRGCEIGNLLVRTGIVAGLCLLIGFSYNPIRIFYPTGQSYARNLPYDNYSQTYLDQVAAVLKENQVNPVGGCILGSKDLDYYYAYSPLHYTLGLYLPYFTNNAFVYSMSEFFTPFPKDPYEAQQARDNTASGVFYKFVQAQKARNQFRSVFQSQVDFIRKYKVGYVIVSPNAPRNAMLETLVKTELKDPATGERFLLLKN